LRLLQDYNITVRPAAFHLQAESLGEDDMKLTSATLYFTPR
jgi:hypothetical protein